MTTKEKAPLTPEEAMKQVEDKMFGSFALYKKEKAEARKRWEAGQKKVTDTKTP
jgi:predicted negative regulator of RcsB-dependent stress response